jgi:hypothetical protein
MVYIHSVALDGTRIRNSLIYKVCCLTEVSIDYVRNLILS